MEASKRRKLTRAGWRVGTASEFLKLSPEESALIEIRLRLSQALHQERTRRKLTQSALAHRLGSSQSRIAKMEAGDVTVSIDLLIRGLVALGVSPAGLARVIRTRKRSRAA